MKQKQNNVKKIIKSLKYVVIFLFMMNSLCAQIKDDTMHFYAGFTISVLTAEVTNQLIDRPVISCLVGTSLGVTAGILKENIWDRQMKRGVYSKHDAFMTSWGALCGALVVRVHFDIQDKKKHQLNKQDY